MAKNTSVKHNEFVERTNKMVSALTLDEKLKLLTTHHNAVERLGISEFYIGSEVARGYVGRSEDVVSTVFPQPVGLASTFDKGLMHKLGEIAAEEARAYYNKDKKGGLALWGPTVDMVRDPRWGRCEEAYGEDVCLAGEMTAAYTLGMAGDDDTYMKTIPTLKHFCANNNEADRGTSNSYLPLRLKHEYYYAAFMNAVKYGGARSLMAAYNDINGIPAICNPELKTVVKDKWGLWFVVSDGGDFVQTVLHHKFCSEHSEAFALSLKAGCDTMTDEEAAVQAAARKALADGLITEKDIDNSLFNTLYARHCLGHFDENCPYNSISMDSVDNDNFKRINRRAAMEQVVLLKNNGMLPIKNKPSKIAAVGALADENLMDWYTGYSSGDIPVKQGLADEFKDSEIVYDSLWDYVSIKAANGKYLSAKENGDVVADADSVTEAELFELQDWGEGWKNLFSVKYKRYVRFSDGSLKLHNRRIYDWFTRETFFIKEYSGKYLIEEYLHTERLSCGEDGSIASVKTKAVKDGNLFEIEVRESGRSRAEKIAAECDLVVYCTGNYPVQSAKECYDRTTLEMNVQKGMAEYLYEKNGNTVMVIVSSYPYAVNSENEKLPAIIYTSHAGAYLGTAVAETLSGKNNPAARLPLTWYKSAEDLPDIMNYDIETAGTTYMYFGGTPLYHFGYGLSYSEFAYSGLSLKQSSDGIIVSVNVKNTSDTDGDEVVQIYFTVKNSAVTRPKKKLCGFERVHLKAGEENSVEIAIPRHILQIYDVRSGEMLTERGTYTFYAAKSSADIQLEGEIEIDGGSLSGRNGKFSADSFDSAEGVIIAYSGKLGKHSIKSTGWSASASYGGVDLNGKTTLEIWAQSMIKKEKITLDAGDKKIQLEVNVNDSMDDFTMYTADITGATGNEVAVSFPENVSILDIGVR